MLYEVITGLYADETALLAVARGVAFIALLEFPVLQLGPHDLYGLPSVRLLGVFREIPVLLLVALRTGFGTDIG